MKSIETLTIPKNNNKISASISLVLYSDYFLKKKYSPLLNLFYYFIEYPNGYYSYSHTPICTLLKSFMKDYKGFALKRGQSSIGDEIHNLDKSNDSAITTCISRYL